MLGEIFLIFFAENFGSTNKVITFVPLKASLAQLVEHDTLNVGVLGSSPRGSTATKAVRNDCLFCWISINPYAQGISVFELILAEKIMWLFFFD